MLAYICDKCKNQIGEKCFHFKISYSEINENKSINNLEADICENCYSNFRLLIDFFNKEQCKEDCSRSIDELDFSIRLNNCLKRANINTEDELLNCSLNEIKHIKNLGRKNLEEIIDFLYKGDK